MQRRSRPADSHGMTAHQHRRTEPHSDADTLYVSLWLIGLTVGGDPRLALPAWLSERAEAILVVYRPFAKA